MSDVEIQYSLTINTELAYSDIRKLEITLMRVLGYLKTMIGDERIDRAIMKVQQFISVLRVAQIAMRAFEAATGPVGWAYAATTLVAVAITAGEFANTTG